MKLRILTVGRLRDPGLAAFVAELLQRSRSFLPIEVLPLRETAELRDRAVRPRVVLDERGAEIDSPGLAGWLRTWRDGGVRQVDWLIGGADGFEDADRAAAERVLSLSRMTLPHRLALAVLVEQLYRAGTILAGHPYHHGG